MIQYAVYFYVRLPVSYRDLEEFMAERGVDLDHATLNRWAKKYAQEGKTLDFMLSERRDEAAATAFFVKAIGNNGWPDKVVIDKSGSNTAGLFNINCLLVMFGWSWLITIRQMKHLNNIIEQAHRFIKKLTRSMQTFESLSSASAALIGIEVAHMFRKGQLDQSKRSGLAQFAARAE